MKTCYFFECTVWLKYLKTEIDQIITVAYFIAHNEGLAKSVCRLLLNSSILPLELWAGMTSRFLSDENLFFTP